MGYLKERIKHAVRFRHKRGYGVHSPFMFNLILNVIRDREKQFQYPERLERENCLNHRERKIFRLLSRLVRSLRVHRMICLGKMPISFVGICRKFVMSRLVLINWIHCNLPISFISVGSFHWMKRLLPECCKITRRNVSLLPIFTRREYMPVCGTNGLKKQLYRWI